MRAVTGTISDHPPEMESGNYNEAVTLSPVQSDAVVSDGSEAVTLSRV